MERQGTLLATATFTNETASGWQQVNLSSPVVVTAGTTYVVSYRTSGNYSVTSNYFATSDTNGELTALANGGVYAYGTGSIFPTNSFNASNYWVDVVFNGAPLRPPVANNDSGFDATRILRCRYRLRRCSPTIRTLTAYRCRSRG